MTRVKGSIVLTGATGFLGAFLMAGLLKRGCHITVLGRPSKDMSLEDRLSGLLRWFEITDHGERLVALEADLSKRQFALDDGSYRRLCATTIKIIHCASDTSFLETNRDQVMKTNVHSLSALLDFAADTKGAHLYYVSSAYAAGVCAGLCREMPVNNDNFTNVYEESKAMAEGIITSSCERNRIPFTILRPSIVYGDSQTGKALKFDALYYPVKSLLYLRDIFLKDITTQGGRSRQWGVGLEDDGILILPLAINLTHEGHIDLVPVDYFTECALRIIEHPGSKGIYHITSNKPPDLSTILAYAERFLGLRGARIVFNNSDNGNIKLNPAEELFNRLIKPYRPYLSDRRIFDRSRMAGITPDLTEPAFTYEIFERCMDYAVRCDWGKNLLA